jgi:multidrug efflux pump subunit AcrA (membrane-fusion protein)
VLIFKKSIVLPPVLSDSLFFFLLLFATNIRLFLASFINVHLYLSVGPIFDSSRAWGQKYSILIQLSGGKSTAVQGFRATWKMKTVFPSIKKPVSIVCLMLLPAALTLLHGCSSAKSLTAPPSMAMPVKVQRIDVHEVEESSNFVGVLKSRQSVAMQPQVAGQICKIYVKSGDAVKAGQPLVELDRTKQEASVNSVAATMESNQEESKNAQQTLRSLEATRVSKMSTLKYDQQQQERYAFLKQAGAVSQESLDQWDNQTKIAQAELQSVEAQIEAQKAMIGKMSKVVKQSAASVKEQQAQLKYCTVCAPIAGIIGDIPMRVGEYATTGTVLTTVDDPKSLELYLNIPTIQAPRLSLGMPVELVDHKGNSLDRGKVFFISPSVNNENQSVLVKTHLDNSANRFRSGQYVTARLIWSKGTGISVPVTAVSRISGQDFIFCVERGPGDKTMVKQKPVKLGDIIGDSYTVLSGVAAGETVVTSGVQNLSDGATVAPQT